MDGLTLDHLGIVVPDLDRAAETYRRLGFTLTRRSSHKKQTDPDGPFEPIGSGNYCVMFRQGYLELIGITDPSKPHDSIAKRLQRYAGLQLIALGCDDADAVEHAWSQATEGCEPAVILGRDVPLAQGGSQHGAFKIVYLSDEAVPEVDLFAIQHLTPDVLWQPALLQHPNGAIGLQSATIVSDDAGATTARLTRLGLVRKSGPHGDRFVFDGGGWVDVLTSASAAKTFPNIEPPALPCAIASSYWVEDLSTTTALLEREGIEIERLPNRLRVPPDLAEGCVIDFVTR